MENKKQQGGKRRGAGRKPVLSKKKQVSLYVEGSKIIKFGNEEKMKDRLYGFIEDFGLKDIIYSVPTPAAFDAEKMSKIIHDEPAMFQEVKSPITGLQPKLSFFAEFMAELGRATTIPQVEEIMRRVKGEVFTPRDKMALDAKAKEVSKDMFND